MFQVVLVVFLLKKESICPGAWIQMCPIANTVLMCLVFEHTFELLQGKLVYRCKMCSLRECRYADSEAISLLLLLYMNLLLHEGTVTCFLWKKQVHT